MVEGPKEGAQPVSELHRGHLRAIAETSDREAFSRLFEYYAPRLIGFFKKRNLAHGPAEDLAQEVMLTVWRKAKLYDTSASAPSTWIYTIARNRFVDVVRKERFVEPLEPGGSDASKDPEANEESAEDQIEAAQLAQRVEDALAEIPEEQACVVREAYLSDKTFSRIAAERALPLGTVKTRARLALNKLRVALGGEE